MTSTSPRTTAPRWTSAAALSAITLAGALLAYFRLPGVSAGTVWAEDGALFLQEYLEQGPGLLNPYAGYLHFLPRAVVAVVTPVFGLEWYSLAVTAACCLVVGLVAALTFYCSTALTPNVVPRLCWASIPVLAAPAAIETIGNAANLHWFMLWLAPWVLIKVPDTTGQKFLLGGTALVISLTEIQAAVFLPLLFFKPGIRSLWWAKTGLAAGLAAQLFTLWRFPRFGNGMDTDVDALSVILGYPLNTSAALFYGDGPTIGDLIQRFGSAPIILSAVPFVLAVVLLMRVGDPVQRFMGGVWLIASVVLWAAAVIVNPAPYFNYSHFTSAADWEGFFLSRYSAVPSMFLLALLPLLICRIPGTEQASGPLAAFLKGPQFRGGVVGAFIILQSVYYFPAADLRSLGPEWAPQVRAAIEACRNDPGLAEVDIQQAPIMTPWATEIPCAELRP